MDILKTSVEWAKAEVFSSFFFILFAAGFLAASYGFWQIGRTDLAKAFVVPTLVAGGLLMIIGLGIFAQSQSRVSSFVTDYQADKVAFVEAELARADKVMNQYRVAVFKVIPLIVIVSAALLHILDTTLWRASLITTIALMAVVMMIDSNANARLEDYKENLLRADRQD